MNEDYVSYDTCVEREKMAYDAAIDKVLEIIDKSHWTEWMKDEIRAAVLALREGGGTGIRRGKDC